MTRSRKPRPRPRDREVWEGWQVKKTAAEPLLYRCDRCGVGPGTKCRNYLGKDKQPCPDRGLEPPATVEVRPAPIQPTLFDDVPAEPEPPAEPPPVMYAVWHRPGRGSRWRKVATCATTAEANRHLKGKGDFWIRETKRGDRE